MCGTYAFLEKCTTELATAGEILDLLCSLPRSTTKSAILKRNGLHTSTEAKSQKKTARQSPTITSGRCLALGCQQETLASLASLKNLLTACHGVITQEAAHFRRGHQHMRHY